MLYSLDNRTKQDIKGIKKEPKYLDSLFIVIVLYNYFLFIISANKYIPNNFAITIKTIIIIPSICDHLCYN